MKVFVVVGIIKQEYHQSLKYDAYDIAVFNNVEDTDTCVETWEKHTIERIPKYYRIFVAERNVGEWYGK